MTGDLHRALVEQRVADLLREGEAERRSTWLRRTTRAERRLTRPSVRIARPRAQWGTRLHILRARASGR